MRHARDRARGCGGRNSNRAARAGVMPRSRRLQVASLDRSLQPRIHSPSANHHQRAIEAMVPMPKQPFLTDIQSLRDRARQHIEQGAVTPGYTANRTTVIDLLNTALATELVCVLRYRRHHFMAQGIHGKSVAAEFLAHATEELGHADLLAARIVQLGGAPDFSPDGLASRSHAQYVAGDDLGEMIQEDLVAERIAIDSYGETIRYLGNDDPTTRRMLEAILATEEEHADDLATMLKELVPVTGV
jgi:bacterioferritin